MNPSDSVSLLLFCGWLSKAVAEAVTASTATAAKTIDETPAILQLAANAIVGCGGETGSDDDDDGDDGAAVSFDDVFGKYGWPVWVILMLMSFWGLAVVVEDFFVPALNRLCVVLNMPDDVAGATFMAAGASSPEMFAAFVSLFITRTSLGIGTIIGSEIFNHLCICAGSMLYSKSGVLELDARILARDMGFYALAIIVLLYCEWDRRECKSSPYGCSVDWDDAVGDERRIYLHWHQPLLMIGCYGVYVVVCSFYDRILHTVCLSVETRKEEGSVLDPGNTVVDSDIAYSAPDPASILDNVRQSGQKAAKDFSAAEDRGFRNVGGESNMASPSLIPPDAGQALSTPGPLRLSILAEPVSNFSRHDSLDSHAYINTDFSAAIAEVEAAAAEATGTLDNGLTREHQNGGSQVGSDVTPTNHDDEDEYDEGELESARGSVGGKFFARKQRERERSKSMPGLTASLLADFDRPSTGRLRHGSEGSNMPETAGGKEGGKQGLGAS